MEKNLPIVFVTEQLQSQQVYTSLLTIFIESSVFEKVIAV